MLQFISEQSVTLKSALHCMPNDLQAGESNGVRSPMAASGLLRQQPSPEHLVSVLVDQLEALTCAGPDNTIPASLQAIVDHTFQCVRRPYLPAAATGGPAAAAGQHTDALNEAGLQVDEQVAAEESASLDEAWQCLAELLCDEDEYAASVGQTWLYRILVEAADQHIARVNQQFSAVEEPGKQHDDESFSRRHEPHVIGLLPHPLGGPPKPDAPAHLLHQPELAGLLRVMLSYTGVDTGHRFMTVLRRLLLHTKLKCTAPSAG